MICMRDRDFSGHVWIQLVGSPPKICYTGNSMYNNITALAEISGLLSDYYVGVF